MIDLLRRMEELSTPAATADREGKRLLPFAAVRQLAEEADLPVREVELRALRAHILPGRYERSHGTVGWAGQIKLLESTVAVLGCGGLGGWVVEGLSRMGVGRLIVIDGDSFAENNLNRQVFCTEGGLGQLKTEAVRTRVAAVNSATELMLHSLMADEEDMVRLLAEADVVVDALDSIPTRLVLQKVAQTSGIPMVHGAIAGYVGHVMTILPGDEGLYAIYGQADVAEKGAEAQLGNPAATPMMISAWQIQEVIKILLGAGDLLRNRMLLMDAESGMAQVLEIRGS